MAQRPKEGRGSRRIETRLRHGSPNEPDTPDEKEKQGWERQSKSARAETAPPENETMDTGARRKQLRICEEGRNVRERDTWGSRAAKEAEAQNEREGGLAVSKDEESS